jgi:hypothetical protein
VRAAFKKLDGIVAADVETDIKIEAGDKPGTQKVTFKSTSDKISKQDAIKKLGSKASRYVVKDLKKADAKKDSKKEEKKDAA